MRCGCRRSYSPQSRNDRFRGFSSTVGRKIRVFLYFEHWLTQQAWATAQSEKYVWEKRFLLWTSHMNDVQFADGDCRRVLSGLQQFDIDRFRSQAQLNLLSWLAPITTIALCHTSGLWQVHLASQCCSTHGHASFLTLIFHKVVQRRV